MTKGRESFNSDFILLKRSMKKITLEQCRTFEDVYFVRQLKIPTLAYMHYYLTAWKNKEKKV